MKHYFVILSIVLVGFVAYAKDAQAQQGRVILDSDENEYTTEGIDTTKESGEKAGTEDINIGVGELREGDPDRPLIEGSVPNNEDGDTTPGERIMQPEFGANAEPENSAVQHNETDLEFLAERASDVSVSRVEVRGWDPKKKEEILGAVKTHAEVQSGQDLELFAQGVLLEHEAIEAIETSAAHVQARSRVPAKLFGVFTTSIEQETTVTFGDGQQGARVKVKFPWLRFLYQIDNRYRQEGMEQMFLPEVNDEVLVGFENGEVSAQAQASVIQKLVSFLQ